jgi:acyl-homoserine-lactone acylase
MTRLFSHRLRMSLFQDRTRRLPLVAGATSTCMIAGACALPGAAPPAQASPASSASLPAADSAAHTTSTTYFAEIRRTEYGIPHILAHDYADLGYGYGYAFAQDNLCTMANRVVTLRGERSEYFGPTADSGDTLGASTDNLDSDTYYRGLLKSGVEQRLLARPLGPTQQARDLVNGYVAGYNSYLADTGVAHPTRPDVPRPGLGHPDHRARRVDAHV